MISKKKLWIFVRDAFIIPIVTCAIFFPIYGPVLFIMTFVRVPIVSEIFELMGDTPNPTIFDAIAVGIGSYFFVLVIIIPFTFMWALFTPRKD